jgi:hypothetical protein
MSCIFYFEGNNKFASYLVFAVLALDNCCSVAFDCNAGSLAGNQPEFISTQFNNGLKQKKTFFLQVNCRNPWFREFWAKHHRLVK